MKVLDIYKQTDKFGNGRDSGTEFTIGSPEYKGKSHTISYLFARQMMQDAGQIMGFDDEKKLDELEERCLKIIKNRKHEQNKVNFFM